MNDLLEKIDQCAAYLQSALVPTPDIGIVLGTGLNNIVSMTKIHTTIPYHDLPGFAPATVEFHKGQLIFGTLSEKKVMIMQGRYHYYEGYAMQQITFPIRVMKKLGVRNLILSNAAGGIRKDLKKGELVLIEDHINLQPENPLRGLNDPAFGNRFVDMCAPYNSQLTAKLKLAGQNLSIPLKEGVYAAVPGPNLETRAEYRYLKNIGADLVGMSTVPEIIVANHISLPCVAISVVTDECDPDDLHPVDITEIIKVAGEADLKLSNLLAEAVRLIEN